MDTNLDNVLLEAVVEYANSPTARKRAYGAEKAKRYREKYPGRVAENVRRFRAKHPEAGKKYREANRDDLLRKLSEYKKSHLWIVTAAAARRRAAVRRAVPAWADMEHIQLIYEYAQELSWHDGVQYHVDHIVPLISDVVCGLHVQHNLRVIPAHENVLKSNLLQET